MPPEPEMPAMTPVLFIEETALLGQLIYLADDAVMKQEVLDRSIITEAV